MDLLNNKETPLVSVIMATYNGTGFIQEAIFSVLNQIYSNMEILICDDDSQDGTVELIQEIKHQHDTKNQIQIIKQCKNLGISKNMNTGLEAANGKYTAILDQDDFRLDKEKIFKEVTFLENNSNHGFVGTNIIVNKNGTNMKNSFPTTDEEIRKVILGVSPIQHSAIMYHKSLAREIGGYAEKYKYTMDYQLFLDLMKKAKGANLSDITTYYRLHESNFTINNIINQRREMLDVTRTNKKYFPNATKAVVFRIGNVVLSTLLGDNDLYRDIAMYIKNGYQNSYI